VEIRQSLTFGELLNVCILGLTLLLLLVYTLATIGLWKEARLQSYLSISPFLIFEIDGRKFVVRNMGNSAAFNINMEDLRIFVTDTPKKEVFRLCFDEINILESKDRKQLTYRNYINGQQTSVDISPHLNPKYQKESNQIFTLSYTNTIGIRYYTRFQTGKDGVRLLNIGRVKLRHRLVFWIKIQKDAFRLRWRKFAWRKRSGEE
jgi:hypothetical protein